MIKYISILSLLIFINCLSYDIHPDYLMGSQIFDNNSNHGSKEGFIHRNYFENSKPIYILGRMPNIKIIKTAQFNFSEFYGVPIFTGGALGYLGTRENGELNGLLKNELNNIYFDKNSYIIIQNIQTKIRTNSLLDLCNNYFPCGFFFRYYPLEGSAEIGIANEEEVKNYFSAIENK
ncbi:MAG: hypothetical protein KDK36_05760 [Leptospiraceae bacterium]|nr:hypothetical protein [Leptospiraceae bacterium]